MSTTLPVIDATGSTVREFAIEDGWLERERGDQAVHEMVTAYLANQRAGTACTKTRGEVSGGGAKPWRQKGTGRARSGSNRSPVWRGGGVIFGPRPRSYSRRINKKVRQLALRRAFTGCLDAGSITLVDAIDVSEPKTRLVVDLLKNVGASQAKSVLLVLPDASNRTVVQAARNIDGLTITSAQRLNVYDLVRHQRIVISEAALRNLGSRLS